MDRGFGTGWGVLIDELKILARAVFVLDAQGVVQYAQAKRAQVILAEQLATRLAAQQVVVNAMHPGWADTGGVRSSLPRFFAVTRAILRSPAQGADTIVWLAASARAGQTTGQLWFDRRVVSAHLWSRTEERPGDRARLWDACAEDAGRTPDGSFRPV
jgi:NAD(P)-dependent dehydrogenase (short-subunit alcohol dehydrogenase family)